MPADPPAGPGMHASLETLAELDEGLLAPALLRQTRMHLAACPDCSARLEAVAGIRTALAAAPPERLPVDVGARLDAALARAGRSSRIERRAMLRPTGRPRWRPGGGLLAAGAAASIVVLLFGAIVVGALRSGSHTSSDSSLATDAGSSAEKRAGRPPGPVTTSGRDYTAASLRAEIPALLGRQATSLDQRMSTAAQAPAALRGVNLADCVTELAGGRGIAPLAVDLARYAGEPAVIVVLPEAGPAGILDVWVVRPGCTRGDPQLIYFTRLPRPAGISSP